jgi:hypothetical protein
MRLVLLVALGGCVSATAPRDYHCVYPGDTVGVIQIGTSCTFIVQKQQECSDAINSRILFHAKDCE